MDNSWKKLNNVQRLLYRELYKKSLYDFVKAFWECCDPSKLIDGFLIKYYCEIFHYMCRGWLGYKEIPVTIPEEYKDFKIVDIRQNKQNACINVPPRHSKTMVFSVIGPVWLWISYPIKAASISHTFGLSKDINSKRQRLLNSEKFLYFFGDVLALTNNTQDQIKDNRGGELYAKNRESMTGYGCDLAIPDDISNAEQARKDKQEMANAWSFFQTTLPSRINDPTKGVIMNVQQRLAPNDVTGRIMNDKQLSSTYVFIIIPAIFEEDTVIVCPISGDIHVFRKGDFLWPERFGNYEALRLQVGEGVFQTQYLQKPVATDRTVIKPSMIFEKDVRNVPDIYQADMIYASHDFPVKDKETSDFLGSVIGYTVNGILYIKSCLEKKMAFVESVEYVRSLSERYPGIIQIIEDKANGAPIIQQLRDYVAGLQTFQPGTHSKMQRLESASLYIENVVFVRDQYDPVTLTYSLSEGLQNLKLRVTNYPFVEHDDIVDAFTQLALFVFADRKFMVYGRTFNEYNIIEYAPQAGEYSAVFFNKDNDLWKIAEIAVRYGEESKLVVKREWVFTSSVEIGIMNLKLFAPDENVFIDASGGEQFYNSFNDGIAIEKYNIDNFEQSVNDLNMAFGKKLILIDKDCRAVKADIESFKYDKTKNESLVFKTEKDGFVSCIRTAMKYYSI